MRYLSTVFGLILSSVSSLSYATTLEIAVASNFAEPAKQIAQQFEQQTKIQVSISSAATGVLANQIRNGAPYKIFLSADQTTPKMLIKTGYAITSSQFTYAQGQLVLWSANPHLIDSSSKILTTSNFKYLAIANPKLAPYGAAGYQTLSKLGLTQQLQSKIVNGDNISNTYQYVASGNDQLGFVALAQIMQKGKISQGSSWIVPTSINPLIKQDGIILKAGASDPNVTKFINFMRSESALTILRTYGYR